jgi:hypothetical protein
MTSFLQRHPVAFFLAVVAIVLGAVVAIEAALGLGQWKGTAGASGKAAPPAETKLTPPMSATLAEQAYPETAQRPLFTPTRRPAPAAPVAGNTMAKGQFTLQGVIGVGGLQIALLREKSNGKLHRVEKGKEVNGATLASVEPDKVTLSQGGDSEVLTLAVQKGPAAPAAAPPAPGAPAAPPPPQASGPFGPAPGAAPPGAPQGQPSAPGAIGTPAAGAPPAAPQPPAANPATRSGFGPFTTPTPPGTTPSATTGGDTAGAMTPEELLARRRARRAQQPGQQPQN